ncbi:MAG: Tol-Pal system beta propeller repeat protein TolB [Myxococcota bacterium]|nr:Tol-Pal system beta propeller repeat protein TolB [Myxococcota bacterium]
MPWLLAIALVASAANAQRRPPIIIENPGARAYRVAIQEFRPSRPGSESAAAAVEQAMERGLAFAALFDEVDRRAFLGPTRTPPLDRGDPVVCPNWSQIGADALIQAEIEEAGEGVRAEFKLTDVSRCVAILHKRYRITKAELNRMGHAMADDVVAAFTGQPGVSDTEVAFISTRTGAKEVHVMNADGSGVRAATKNRSLNLFPGWSPDGDAIVYTSYRYRVRPQLFLLTRGERSPGRILRNLDSSRPLYRGVFSPTGDRLAVVMSVDGAAEIFTVGRQGQALKRLTRSGAIEMSPSWSPDSRRMALVSDRTGSPQVYVMNADGSGLRRLTFNGSYNTNPSWSPDGRWIAYESRVGGQFDIWLIDPEGRTNTPLVTHSRSDEHPSWAPDGRKIAFASTRRGRSDIYVIDINGKNLRRVTNEGENTNPAWGPYRR